ncbi:MerR family transcriptional regulator [Lentzea sp. BCCO 10_0856]|uniref:MerR family transcriptional regulator n=1 Tax=Lentzea miocenica TaxID=3095431 RepID=A0ABU4TG93_9PSEU|nr:MerR family transcriptional regulator [Lentzea sp. BCCO 10_0856]MDX8037192.1 MerR family transcriptional regulator [Lentzea sp. BCCO 10_0856]
MTAGRPQRGVLSIGAVLSQLRPEFPDVTISKIRFLEAEGLVRPARTASGYRQFSVADVERLRFVLSAQRDRYLPLKVIREQLDTVPADSVSVSRIDLLAQAGISAEQLSQLERDGLLRAGPGGRFTVDDLATLRMIRTMTGLGVEREHLRAVRAAADHEVVLLKSFSDPETVRELADLFTSLHTLLVRAGLRQSS